MAVDLTRPAAEDLRFRSSATGEHILDVYLEACEKGNKTLPELLDLIYNDAGEVDPHLIEFRVEPTRRVMQWRVGLFADPTSGFADIPGGNLLRAMGDWVAGQQYEQTDMVKYNKDFYMCLTATANTIFDPAEWWQVLNVSELEYLRDEVKASTASANASQTAAATSEVNAALSAAEAKISETNAGASAGNAATSESNAANSATNLSTAVTSAAASASSAAISEQNTATSATNAKASETASKVSETHALASETAAKISETNSKASETNSKTSETTTTANTAQVTAMRDEVAANTTLAQNAANTASQKALDAAASEASAADSALTATQAAQAVTGALIDAGPFDASSGRLPIPATINGIVCSSIWKVTVAGIVGGIELAVGDSLVYTSASASYYKIDNTESVSSVNGQQGIVTLDPDDVGADPAGTAAGLVTQHEAKAGAHPISGVAGLQTALDSKFNTTGGTVSGPMAVTGGVTADVTGNASTATKLATARTLTIGNTGKTFDGSAGVAWTLAEIGAEVAGTAATAITTHEAKTSAHAITGVTGLQAALDAKLGATATAASATILATARTINGTSFNGSAAITTASWGTARTLTIGNTGKSVDGSGDVSWTLAELGAAAIGGANATGTWPISVSGNAATATSATSATSASSAATLTTARTINGTSFNGSAAITTASWGTARTITIGSTGKSVDGSAAVSWTAAEMGVVPTSDVYTAGVSWASIVGKIPRVGTDGVLEIGAYVDFHVSGSTADYDTRLSCTTAGTLVCTSIFYGNSTGNFSDVYIRSDARLKSNYADIDGALEKVRALKGCTYDKQQTLTSETTTREAGLIAQDVAQVLPEAVAIAGEEALLTISPAAVNALLVEAIKELAAKVDALEKRLLQQDDPK